MFSLNIIRYTLCAGVRLYSKIFHQLSGFPMILLRLAVLDGMAEIVILHRCKLNQRLFSVFQVFSEMIGIALF